MDKIHNPDHYTAGGIETIQFIQAKLGKGFVHYCVGNVLKYISRYDKKGNPKEDLEKAKVYLEWAIEEVERKKNRENDRYKQFFVDFFEGPAGEENNDGSKRNRRERSKGIYRLPRGEV